MRQPAFQHCIATELPATLGFDNGHLVDATLFNLSRSGALVRTRASYPPAKSGTLTVRTGGTRRLRLPVTIVHRGNRVVGLMLGALDSASSAELEGLLRADAPHDRKGGLEQGVLSPLRHVGA